MKNALCFSLLASFLVVLSFKNADAALIPIDNFTQISNAAFIDMPGSNVLSTVTFGSLTISYNPSRVTGSFGNWPVGTPADPGNGEGYLTYTYDSRINTSPIVLDFNLPLAAFGVSFFHMNPERARGDLAQPAQLLLYDGAHGTGNLLGGVYSSGFDASLGLSGHQDFVGAWSDILDIRSAIIAGTGPNLGFGVDGYGVSFSPRSVLEPSTISLMALSIIFFGPMVLCSRRNRRHGKLLASK